MKAIYFIILFFLSFSTLLSLEVIQPTQLFNKVLNNQASIEKINYFRPNIYLYTDFGGGKNLGAPIADLQTSGEIASAGWKATLQQTIYINDSAKPLAPHVAALRLAETFPYQKPLFTNLQKTPIHTLVIHVIDPGVGNEQGGTQSHPRSLVLRKDGILFIGPDNGTLTLACPDESIEGIWEINKEFLNQLSGIDVEAGGTFHGRDLFSEAAFRIASGTSTLQEIGIPYTHLQLRTKFTEKTLKKAKLEGTLPPIAFAIISTERAILTYDQHTLFETAFLLGIIQSPLYQEGEEFAQTNSKKVFFLRPKEPIDEEPIIAIVNEKTGNIFIGPNNGLGISFFKNYSPQDVRIYQISAPILEKIVNEKNNEIAYNLIQSQESFRKKLQEIDYLGDEKVLIRDSKGRPHIAEARIWIDLYGNLKTTLQSNLLNEAKQQGASVKALLNGIEKKIIWADTFSQVAEEQLFIYNGSTAVIGPNPQRSKRYVELTANGIYGKFGIDAFETKGNKPTSGQVIKFFFEYPEERA